jgi:hypothetical protein
LVVGLAAGIAGALERRAAMIEDPRARGRAAFVVGATAWAIVWVGFCAACLQALAVAGAIQTGSLEGGFACVGKFARVYEGELGDGAKTFAFASVPFGLHAFASATFQRDAFRIGAIWGFMLLSLGLVLATTGIVFSMPPHARRHLRLDDAALVCTCAVNTLLPIAAAAADTVGRRLAAVLE